MFHAFLFSADEGCPTAHSKVLYRLSVLPALQAEELSLLRDEILRISPRFQNGLSALATASHEAGAMDGRTAMMPPLMMGSAEQSAELEAHLRSVAAELRALSPREGGGPAPSVGATTGPGAAASPAASAAAVQFVPQTPRPASPAPAPSASAAPAEHPLRRAGSNASSAPGPSQQRPGTDSVASQAQQKGSSGAFRSVQELLGIGGGELRGGAGAPASQTPEGQRRFQSGGATESVLTHTPVASRQGSRGASLVPPTPAGGLSPFPTPGASTPGAAISEFSPGMSDGGASLAFWGDRRGAGPSPPGDPDTPSQLPAGASPAAQGAARSQALPASPAAGERGRPSAKNAPPGFISGASVIGASPAAGFPPRSSAGLGGSSQGGAEGSVGDPREEDPNGAVAAEGPAAALRLLNMQTQATAKLLAAQESLVTDLREELDQLGQRPRTGTSPQGWLPRAESEAGGPSAGDGSAADGETQAASAGALYGGRAAAAARRGEPSPAGSPARRSAARRAAGGIPDASPSAIGESLAAEVGSQEAAVAYGGSSDGGSFQR